VEADAVTIENRRFDPEQNAALSQIASQFAKAFGYTAEDLDIDPTLAQLLRLRVSQLNNCTYCLNLHYEAARTLEIPRAKIDTLSAWWETDLFTAAEQAAFKYTEALTRVADTTVADRFASYHDELVMHFTESEIVAIVGVVINMNVWTRLKLAQGATPTF
jgi:AhpD family alkylhydroperoxidase